MVTVATAEGEEPLARHVIALAALAIMAAPIPSSVCASEFSALSDPARLVLDPPAARPAPPAGPTRPEPHGLVKQAGFKHFKERCELCHGG